MDNKENQLIFFLIGLMVISITGIIIYFTRIKPINSNQAKNKIQEKITEYQEKINSALDNTNDEDKETSSIEKIAISVARDNAYGYLNQISKSVTQKSFKDSDIYHLNGSYSITEDGKKLQSNNNSNEVYEITYTGTYPSSGTLIYVNDVIQENSTITVNNYTFKTDQNGSLNYDE